MSKFLLPGALMRLSAANANHHRGDFSSVKVASSGVGGPVVAAATDGRHLALVDCRKYGECEVEPGVAGYVSSKRIERASTRRTAVGVNMSGDSLEVDGKPGQADYSPNWPEVSQAFPAGVASASFAVSVKGLAAAMEAVAGCGDTVTIHFVPNRGPGLLVVSGDVGVAVVHPMGYVAPGDYELAGQRFGALAATLDKAKVAPALVSA